MSTKSFKLRRYLPLTVAVISLATLVAGFGDAESRKPAGQLMGQITDWSSRHVLYSHGVSLRALAASQRDPRAYWNYLNLMRRVNAASAATMAGPGARRNRPSPPNPQVDWSLSLGSVGMAADMYPAKFSFDVNASPDCTNDYVVYTINSAPSASQANIAAFNNLYSGTAGGVTGICGPGSATPYWAYRVSAVPLPTSPILSLDGTKVAFVDHASPPVFHVLTWTAGQGTVSAPATPAPAQIVNVTLTGATLRDSNSSPFMDYLQDTAYVGTDSGQIFKITGVFSGTPALAGAPWPVAAAGVLTGPVLDFQTGNVLVGSSNGRLYGFSAAGVALPGSPLIIGNGTTRGGLIDAPVEDVLDGLVYEFTGNTTTPGTAVAVQTSTSGFTSKRVASIGLNNQAVIHSGSFNEAYFSSPTNQTGTTSEWFLYVCGVGRAVRSPVLYRVGFDASRVMNTAVDPSAQISLSNVNFEQCSPLTDFANGADRLFLSLRSSGLVEFFDVSTSTTPLLGGTGGVAPVAEGGGTTGIIIDNVSAANQASSIYFGTLGTGSCGAHCAVKLTQGGLQ